MPMLLTAAHDSSAATRFQLRLCGRPPKANVPACTGTSVRSPYRELRLAALVAGILGAIAIAAGIALVVLAALAAALLPAAALL